MRTVAKSVSMFRTMEACFYLWDGVSYIKGINVLVLLFCRHHSNVLLLFRFSIGS